MPETAATEPHRIGFSLDGPLRTAWLCRARRAALEERPRVAEASVRHAKGCSSGNIVDGLQVHADNGGLKVTKRRRDAAATGNRAEHVAGEGRDLDPGWRPQH